MAREARGCSTHVGGQGQKPKRAERSVRKRPKQFNTRIRGQVTTPTYMLGAREEQVAKDRLMLQAVNKDSIQTETL